MRSSFEFDRMYIEHMLGLHYETSENLQLNQWG